MILRVNLPLIEHTVILYREIEEISIKIILKHLALMGSKIRLASAHLDKVVIIRLFSILLHFWD